MSDLESIKAKRKPLTRGREFTDADNAERLIEQYGDNIIYVPGVGYMVYNGRHWRDGDADVMQLAIDAARHIEDELKFAATEAVRNDILKHRAKSLNAPRIKAMFELAATNPKIRVNVEQLDAHEWKFNCKNGTIDLRTGELKDHDLADLITNISPVEYVPGLLGPSRYERCVSEVFADDPSVALFWQRFLGHSLTGCTAAHLFTIAKGSGGNGKSLIIEATRRVFGTYAASALPDTFMATKNPKILNDLARMVGKRLVTISETERGKELDEGLVKATTGDETLSVRFFYKEPFEYRPQFKPLLVTNDPPRIKGLDNGIWRRIRVVSFNQTFPIDDTLADILKHEPELILNWLVRGCLDWQRDGFGEAKGIKLAVAQYRADNDSLHDFLTTCCVVEPEAKCKASDLYNAYAKLCRADRVAPMNTNHFADCLREHGFIKKRSDGMVYHGLRLREPTVKIVKDAA